MTKTLFGGQAEAATSCPAGERAPEVVVIDVAGRRRARSTDMEMAIPSWRPVAADELDRPYFLASWDPDLRNEDGSRGCVYLNKEHPALVALVEDMARDHSVARSDVAWTQIEHAVWEMLGQSLVAKVVHAESVLRRHVELTTLRREYLSDVALTTAGLGMIWEQQALQPLVARIVPASACSCILML